MPFLGHAAKLQGFTVMGCVCVALLTLTGHSSAQTSDGRAYELVSPADKNGADVTADGLSIVAASAGDAVAFASRGSFGNTLGSGSIGQTQYLARRTANGWSSQGITPTPAWNAVQTFIGGTSVQLFSTDLKRASVWAYPLPEVNGATDSVVNMYVEDTLSRALQLVTASSADPLNFLDTVDILPFGASDDLRHIALVTAWGRLLPEAPSRVPSVYEWHDGVLRLASILPNGTIPPEGATILPASYRRMVSPDGARVMFLSPPRRRSGRQLYARIDQSRSVWVSEPERRDGFVPTPEDVSIQEVTRDSEHVIFSTAAPLVDADGNDGSDLYLYTDSNEPASETNLTPITSTGDISAASVVGSSADGARVYFTKNSGELFLWDHGTIHLVTASLHPNDFATFPALASGPGNARVSPDGRYLAFLTEGSGDGIHGLTGEVTNGAVEMYLYDAHGQDLRCVSCPEGPATSGATVVPTITDNFPRIEIRGLRPSFLASDGRVFFSTGEALVTQDTNGVLDAYAYDPATGEHVLLSTGKGSEPASFVEAGENGADVFIVTRQQLVRADRDAYVDMYDARIGGGFPDPPAPPGVCEGDACQGPPPSSPERPAIGSRELTESAFGPLDDARARILRRRAIGGSAGVIRVAVPGPGSVAWTGRGLRRGARRFADEGTYPIRVALTAAARRRLERDHALRVTVRVTFTPALGNPSRASASLRFRLTSSKKGR